MIPSAADITIHVANCVIHDMGHGGIYMAGGDRKSLERGNNMVKNCEFYNVSRLETYNSGNISGRCRKHSAG